MGMALSVQLQLFAVSLGESLLPDQHEVYYYRVLRALKQPVQAGVGVMGARLQEPWFQEQSQLCPCSWRGAPSRSV